MIKRCWLPVLLLALAGCASERIILLPKADGTPSGRVLIKSAGKTLELSESYAAARISGNTIAAQSVSAEEVKQRYGSLLNALPRPAQTFILYFEHGSTHLTEESERNLAAIRHTLFQFPAAEYLVVGHTDRVGSVARNDELSLSRANAVRRILVDKILPSIPAESVSVAGRGEREPLIATEDEVAEPRNRRVEVKVR